MNVHSVFGGKSVAAVTGDKRERILQAASVLIVQNGLQCPMSKIADLAGVAAGTIYLYFRSKDEMILGVYERLRDQAAAALIRHHGPDVPPEARIRAYIDDYITFIWSDPDRAVLFEYLSNVPLIPTQGLRQAFSPVTDFTNAIIEGAMNAGLLRGSSIEDMGGFIGGGIRNTLKWRRATGAELTTADRERIAEMCWNAIARPDAPAGRIVEPLRRRVGGISPRS